MELSELFFWELVEPLVGNHFPALRKRFSAGLIGYGSDVLGYDDKFSRDHEWGPRGQIWLTPQDYTRYAQRLDRLFQAEIPSQYRGFSARYIVEPSIQCLIPAPSGQTGIHHIGITTVRRYLRIQLGVRQLPLDLIDWLCLPEQKLLELTRGKVFTDPSGEITDVRQSLVTLPKEIWQAKMLYAWESTNELLDVVPLNLLRSDERMARINLNRIVERTMRLVFLLNRRYCPGSPKWMAHEFSLLPRLAKEVGPLLDTCLSFDNPVDVPALLETIFQFLVLEHNRQNITRGVNLAPPRFGRGLVSFNLDGIIEAIRESLPAELRDLEIHGGLDQWITNPDILIWSEQYTKFKNVYRKKSRLKRQGVGDKII